MTRSAPECDRADNDGGPSAALAAADVRPRLLLVEDNPLNRLLIGVVLERMDIDHVAVGCAEEAMLRFAREAFDAVLLDVEMDEGIGFDLVRSLLNMAGPDAPPIIALGECGSTEDALEAAGFAGSVALPVDSTRLATALIVALERDIALAEADR